VNVSEEKIVVRTEIATRRRFDGLNASVFLR